MRQPAPSAADLAVLDPDGSFRARLEQDRARLAGLAAEPATTARQAELGAIVHRLAGAAGTFGFLRIGAAAIALDDALADGVAPGVVRPLLAGLLAALAAA